MDKANQAKNDADKQKEDAVSENKTAQGNLNDAQQKYDAAKKILMLPVKINKMPNQKPIRPHRHIRMLWQNLKG